MAKKKQAKKVDVKKVLNGAKKALKKAGHDVRFAPVVPFVPAMKAILTSKGIKPENDIEKLCKQFRNEVVKKHKKFDEVHKNLIDDVVSIVKEIIGFFAESKAKKDAGKQLTNDQIIANAEGEKVANELPSKGMNINPTFILGGAAALFFIVVMIKQRKG